MNTQGKRGKKSQNKRNLSLTRDLRKKIFTRFYKLTMANTTTHKNLKSKIFEFQKFGIVVKRNSSAEVQMRT